MAAGTHVFPDRAHITMRLAGRACLSPAAPPRRIHMDLDALLHTFFGTTDLESLTGGAIAEGCARIGIALGTEVDPGRRFALWALLHGLGEAPDPARIFEDRGERDAALAYARALDQAEQG